MKAGNMNIEYGNPLMKNTLNFYMGDPNAFSKSHDAEMINKFGRHDPLKPPRKERGDIYIILGTIIGGFIGIISGSFWNVFTLFAGLIIGAIIGATAGNFIKKRRWGKSRDKEKRELS